MSAGLLGGALGAVGGFFIGGLRGAMYGYSIGSALGSYINPPKGPHLEGPRLSDLSVQTSTYGAVIPRGYGIFPVIGNVFWLENNALREVATTTTSSSGGKGGGGSETTQTTYSYYATFAVGLCKGPIAGIRRIWVGEAMIFDAGATELAQLSASAAASSQFTVHYGTDTQLPDARMQATLGAANTPAYRGLAYLVFRDYPLAKVGNTLAGAQVKVEVVVSGDVSPIRFVVGETGGGGVYSAGPGGYIWETATPYLRRRHLPSDTVTCRTPRARPDGGVLVQFGLSADGTLLAGVQHTYYHEMFLIRPSGEQIAIGVTGSPLTGNVVGLGTTADTWVLTKTPGIVIYTIGEIAANAPGGTYYPLQAGSVIVPWVYLLYTDVAGVYSLVRFDPVDNLFQHLFTLPANYGGIQDSRNYAKIVAAPNGYFYVHDITNNAPALFDAAGSLLATGAANLGQPIMYHGSGKLVVRSGSTWRVCDALTLAAYPGMTTQDYNSESIDTFNAGVMRLYEKALIIIDTPASDTTLLSDIVSAEMLQSGLLSSGDINTATLTQTVRGYRIASVAAIRSALEPLMGAWPFDVVQHGYKIKCVPRGGASIATVAAGDLDARAADQAPGVAVTTVREMDAVLPARVTLKFLDADREYNDNEQYAERLNTLAVNVQSLDMAIVLTASEAAQIAERLLYLYWLERYDVSFKLPPTYSQIEPADVITINADEGTYSLRLTKIHYAADGRLECQAKYHSAATYTPTAIGEAGQSTGRPIVYVGDTRLDLLDLPLLVDSSDRAGFVAAVTGYTDGWPGGVLYSTIDGGQTWYVVQGFSSPSPAIGIAVAAIGAGRTDLIDKASVLQVSMIGELSSTTEAAMLNGANHFAYGANGRWEIIAAQNCVLQGDGTYKLTDLLRGRAGTDWACGLHGITDVVVLLDTATIPFIATSLDTIGLPRTYRAVTVGKTLAEVIDVEFAYTGVNLECLSPVYLNGSRHPSTNDWSLAWIRRTRVGGEWRDYIDAPLSEASEAYEVDIFADGTYATLKRTLTSSTPTVAYTSAQQVADFGSNQGTLYVKVYQLSANVGRGYPLTTSITR